MNHHKVDLPGGGLRCLLIESANIIEFRLIRIKFKNRPLALTCWLSRSTLR